MMRIDNLKGDELATVIRRTSTLETQAPLGYTSISKGRTRFIGEHSLRVEGSADVVGTLNITGQLHADGSITFDGPVTISGVTEITGDTSITGDVSVWGGGKITVAGSVPMVLGVTSNGRPGVEFAGGRMSSDGSRIAMESGGSAVGAAPTFASLSNGSTAIIAMGDGPYMLNLPTTTAQPNVYVDPTNGKMYRSTAGGIGA